MQWLLFKFVQRMKRSIFLFLTYSNNEERMNLLKKETFHLLPITHLINEDAWYT